MGSHLATKIYLSILRAGIAPTISNTTRHSFKLLKKEWCKRNLDRYIVPVGTTDADPTKVLWINTDEIRYETSSYMGNNLNDHGLVADGTWDQTRAKFRNRIEFESLKRHFQHGVSWAETAYYIHVESCLRSDRRFRDFNSLSDAKRFFDRLDNVYERIQAEGYKTQRELLSEAMADGEESESMEIHRTNEIGVNIDRDGTFLWQNRGQHRLIIAKLLQLDEVPVQICTRHAEWQRLRDQIRSSSEGEMVSLIPDHHRRHPDLQDLLG